MQRHCSKLLNHFIIIVLDSRLQHLAETTADEEMNDVVVKEEIDIPVSNSSMSSNDTSMLSQPLKEEDLSMSKPPVARKRTGSGPFAGNCQKKFRSALAKELSSLRVNIDSALLKDKLPRPKSLIYIDVAQDPRFGNRQHEEKSLDSQSNAPNLRRYEESCSADQQEGTMPSEVVAMPSSILPSDEDAMQSGGDVSNEVQLLNSDIECSTEFCICIENIVSLRDETTDV